jgi:hypothetical protein
MKTWGEVDVQIQVFLTLTLVGGELSASSPGCFTRGETGSCTHWTGNWLGPSAGVDDVQKRKILTLPGLELRPVCLPARSQSLSHLPIEHWMGTKIDIPEVSLCIPASFLSARLSSRGMRLRHGVLKKRNSSQLQPRERLLSQFGNFFFKFA